MKLKLPLMSLFVILAFVLGGLCLILFTPLVTVNVARKLLMKQLPGAAVTLNIDRQKFAFEEQGCLKLEGIQLTLFLPEGEYSVRLGELEVKRLWTLKGRAPSLRATGHSGEVNSSSIKLKKVFFDLSANLKELEGWGKAGEMTYNPVKLREISFNISGNPQALLLRDIIFDAYGGQGRGEFLLEFRPATPYSTKIHLEKVDTEQLKFLNKTLFSQVEGRLSGTIILSGNAQGIETLESNLSLTEHAKVPAAVFQWVMDYLPLSLEKQLIQKMIADQDKIPVTVGSLLIKNVGQRRLSGKAQLKGEAVPMDLILPLDINLDGDINALVRTWQGLL